MNASLFSRPFLVLCLQFLLVSTVVALFFPLQAYVKGLGFPDGIVGFLLGADALSALILQPIITPLITAVTAKRWILSGTIVLAAALILEGTLLDPFGFVAARLLQGCGFIAVVSGIMVLFVEVIPKSMSGRAFGWISLIRLTPYAAMPFVYDTFGVAPQRLGPILQWSSGGCAVLSALLLLLPSSANTAEKTPVRPAVFPYAQMIRALFDRALFPIFSAVTLLYAGYSAVFFFLKGYGAVNGLSTIGLFFTVATLVMMAVRAVGGKWFDRWNKRTANVWALVVCSVASGMIPMSKTMPSLIPLAVLCGIGWGIAMPLLNALIFDGSSPETAGLNQNLALLMLQAGFFLGPLAGGHLLSLGGYEAVFLGAAAMTAIAASVLYRRRDTSHV